MKLSVFRLSPRLVKKCDNLDREWKMPSLARWLGDIFVNSRVGSSLLVMFIYHASPVASYDAVLFVRDLELLRR